MNGGQNDDVVNSVTFEKNRKRLMCLQQMIVNTAYALIDKLLEVFSTDYF